MIRPEAFEKLLWWIIVGTRGGATRARIITHLRNHPSNASQLAESLRLDYKTVRHHLELLVENRLLVRVGGKYAATFFLSPELENNYNRFEENLKNLEKTKIGQ